MTASSVLAEWASSLAARGSATEEEVSELLGAASLVARGEEEAGLSLSSSSSSSSPSSSSSTRDVLDALRPLCTFITSAVPGESTSEANVSRVASAAAVLLASLKGSKANSSSSTDPSSSSSVSSSSTTMTKADWQARFTALNAALCSSLEAAALSKGDKETISASYSELVKCWLPKFSSFSDSHSPSSSSSSALEDRSMLTGFKRALRDKASPLPILPAHAAELLSTAVEALEHARRGKSGAGAAGACVGVVSSNGKPAPLPAHSSSFTDDTALALGRHAGDDTALALADQLLAISSREGGEGEENEKSTSSSSSFDKALRSRLFKYACRGLREALRDILDDVGGDVQGRTSGSGSGNGNGGSGSGSSLSSAGGSFASSSADGGGIDSFHRASSSSWLLSALADGVTGLGGGGGGGGGGALVNGGGGSSNVAAFFGAAPAFTPAGTAIDLASIRLPSASFAKATVTLAADLAIGLDVAGSSEARATTKGASVVVVVGAKEAEEAKEANASSRPRRQQGGPHLALACDLLLESIEACVGLAWQAAGPSAAAGRGGFGGLGATTTTEEGSGSGSNSTSALVAAALTRHALDIGTALASAAPELLDATATAGVAAALDAPERVHALMRSAARLADVVCGSGSGGGEGGGGLSKRIWRWDLETKNEEGEENTKPQKPVSSFASAEALTDALSSSLTALLAAAWRAGDVEGVKAALVPLADLGSGSGSGVEKGSAAIRGDASNASFSPARGSFSAVNNSTINDASGGDDDSPYEQQAELLTAGRLAAALAGDAELLAVIVPLLAESGVGGASASSKATAMHVVASLAALAGCGGHLWAYDAQIDAMVKAYKSSEGAAGALLFAGGGSGGVGVEEQGQTSSSPSSAAAASSSPTAGALADALLVAAEGVKHAPLAVRRDLLLRLLALAADVGATTTTTIVPLTRGAAAASAAAASAAAAASSGDSRRDLGALLPAIAAVADAAVDRDAMSRAPKAAAWTDAEPSSSSTEASSSPPKKAAATASASSSSPTIANSSSSPKKKNKASKMMAALKKGASGTPRGAGGGAGGISDSKKREALEREAAEKAKSLIPSFVRRHGEPSAADIVKAFRLLWLYIGMHDFAGLGSGAGSTSSSNVSSTSTTPYPWPASWRAAVGRIAAFTPQIAALGEGESVKMAAELGPRVARLGGFGVAVGGGGAGFGAGAGAAAASSNAFYSVAPARPTTIAAASAAAHARASAGLLRLLGTSALPPMPASPDAPARVAHLLSVATLELSRAELAPLGACVGGGVFDDGGSPVGESDAKAAALPSPVAASPLDLLIDAQQDAEPGLWAGAALAAISDAAAAAYCSRLGGGVGGRGGCGASGEKQNHDSSEDIMPALERLVSSLVAASARSGTVVASAGGGGAMSAKASMLPPPPQSLNKKVKASAFPQALVSLNSSATATTTTTSSSASTLPIGTPARILADVLVAFPALYWRPVLLRSALACCGAEEKMVAPGATTHHAAVVVSGGAAGRKNNHNSSPFSLDGHPSLALARQVLATAASVAPEHAEALLHEQLRGGGGGGGGGKSRGGISSSSSSALALPSSSSSSAPAAALRHAATLMATLDAARPRFDAEAPTAPIAGVEALSRKAYYGGAASAAAASAAMNASSSSSSPSAAAGGSSHGSHRGLSEAVQRLERVLVAFQQQGASGSKLSSSSSSSTSAAAPSLPPPPPSTTVKPTVASLEDAVLSLAAAIVTAAAEEEDEWRKAAAKRAKKLSSSSSSSSLSSSSKPLPPLPSPALSAAIRALGAAPARRLTPVAVRVSTMAWAWVAAAAPGLRVPLAAAVAAAWSRTQDAHAGLFSRSTLFDAELFHMSPGGDPDDHPELTRGVKAHAAWLEYWTELWFSVCADGGGGVGGGSGSGGGGVHVSTSTTSPSTTTPNFTPAVSADAQSIRSLLSRLLHRALENARHLTQHPASGGARARLARLALLLAKSELACSSFSSSSSSPSSSSSSAAAVRASNARLLAQRALRASLLWFEGPPALYGRWSPDEAEEQVSAAAELAALVGDGRWFVEEEVAVSKKKSKTSSPGSFASSSTTTNLTNTTSAPDPVWGHCPGATPEQRVSLLKLLLDAEVERTASWARPLAVPSNPRSPYARFSDHKWRGLVGAAWAVSPKLALSLPERLPESGAVEEALEELVVRHASEPELQGVPRGAAILANSVSNSCGGRKKKKSNSSACGCGGGDGAGEEELGGFSSSSSSFPSSFDPFRSTSPTDALALWAPAPLLQALAMLGGPAGGVPAVRAYALRSLEGCDPEQVSVFLPQLVQLLRADDGGQIRAYLLAAASRSVLYAHMLVCTLSAEGRPPPEAFTSPAVKRSGWTPPEDTGLWAVADELKGLVWQAMPAEKLERLMAEVAFFDAVTGVSGRLYPVAKEERKNAAVQFVKEVGPPPRGDLYLPTEPRSRLIRAIPESASPMQSAAKVPILVAFEVEKEGSGGGNGGGGEDGEEEREDEEEEEEEVDGGDSDKLDNVDASAPISSSSAKKNKNTTTTTTNTIRTTTACIFKVGDDCRQDVLALQVIRLLQDSLKKAGVDLFLAPYGVIPTGHECGIIEVVPDCRSRAALGETADGGLHEIWRREFGAPGSTRFEAARRNFIVSHAGYAIACYLLHAKDRHNGNIMISRDGHLVHIDFGFILGISPGGNLGFETAAFKLSHEMSQLLDPGGRRDSPQFFGFVELCVRGFLAARTAAEPIIAAVSLMRESGLPCFGYGEPIGALRRRFMLERTDAQAAAAFRERVDNAYDSFSTGFYDFVQYLQNAIPK